MLGLIKKLFGGAGASQTTNPTSKYAVAGGSHSYAAKSYRGYEFYNQPQPSDAEAKAKARRRLESVWHPDPTKHVGKTDAEKMMMMGRWDE